MPYDDDYFFCLDRECPNRPFNKRFMPWYDSKSRELAFSLVSQKMDYVNMTPIEYLQEYDGIYSSLLTGINLHYSRAELKPFEMKNLLNKGQFFGLVYLIENSSNPYKYIGKTTTTLNTRLRNHMYQAQDPGRNKGPFQYALQNLPEESFKIELWHICRTEEELEGCEVFWTLYFNRSNTKKMYDLAKNNNYNLVVGDQFSDINRSLQNFNFSGKTSLSDIDFYSSKLPKKKLKEEIFKGTDFSEVCDHFQVSPKTLNNALFKYFGSSKWSQARANIITPYVMKALRAGLDREGILNYLSMNNVNFFTSYATPEKSLSNYLKKYILYEDYSTARHKIFKLVLRSMISQGLTRVEISDELEWDKYLTKSYNYSLENRISYFCNLYWGKGFLRVREDILLPKIKNYIRRGYAIPEIANHIGLFKSNDSHNLKQKKIRRLEHLINKYWGGIGKARKMLGSI